MRTGRPKAPLVLTQQERRSLDSLAQRWRTAPQLARRARIVLASAEGLDNKTVAGKLRLTAQTVGRWRRRFVRGRLGGLRDAPRPGAPRRVSEAQIRAVVIRTLESKPRGATHWSVRSMARAVGLSRMTVSRIWKAFGLQPHSERFKPSGHRAPRSS